VSGGVAGVAPVKQVSVDRSGYFIGVNRAEEIPVFVYNFSDKAVSGALAVKAAAGWDVRLADRVELQPNDRRSCGYR
jgi:hypothetical protein